MSFWPFGQTANSATSLNALLDAYYIKRTPTQQQQQSDSTETLNNENETAKPIGELTINREFVYSILDDPSVLNEINRQNNKLVDFICFGYIDENEEGVIDEDNDLQVETPLTTTAEHSENANATIATKQTGTSVMDILVTLVVSSTEWFTNNEQYFHPSNSYADELEENEDINHIANRVHVASEILSCKIWLVSETLVEETPLLSKLWTFLDEDFSPSCPTIQFFVKINEQLLESRPDQMLNFIRSQDNLVDRFIRHIDITIIMDFLLRIITTDKTDIPSGIIEILSEQRLVKKLLDLLENDSDTSTQSSCGDFLKALISISANTSIDENTIGPNMLTRELVDDARVDQIIRIILKRGNGLSTIVGVVIEIIRKNNSDYDPFNIIYTSVESHPPSTRDPVFLGKMLNKFSDRLDDFNSILIDPKLTSKRIKTQINKDIEPLGFERFKICELVAELLHCSNIQLLNNHLTPSVVAERERIILEQESNLANALNDDITNHPNTTAGKGNNSLNLSNLNIGTSEPVVAVNEKHITIPPHSNPTAGSEPLQSGELPLADQISDSKVVGKRDEIHANPTIGDYFKIQLVKSSVLDTIIEMFTKYPWNNFWHNVVFDIVQQVFNGRIDQGYNQFLILELFDKCDITNLIINAYNLCLDIEVTSNVRLGYMGHLVLIAEEVVKFSSIFQNNKFNDPEIDDLIYSKLVEPSWVSYVTNVLTETREQYNCVLGGIKTDEFQQGDFLNPSAIILGNSEDEILNQETSDNEEDVAPLDEVFYDGVEHHDSADNDQQMTV